MTHIQNIAHILQHGITHRSSINANVSYISIGDSSLIGVRNKIIEPINQRLLGDYIPFYFNVRMPMLLVVQTGYNGVAITPPEDIVYCVCNTGDIVNLGLNFIFTDGHAVDSLSDFYNASSISEINTILDINSINTAQWGTQYGLDIKRKKEAEFLVLNDIPATCIKGYIVYNQVAEQQLLALSIAQNKIVIKPNFYY